MRPRGLLIGWLLLVPLAASGWGSLTVADERRAPHAAIAPAPKDEDWWRQRHAALIELARTTPDTRLVFLGDSITQGWGEAGRDTWARHYAPRRALNLGLDGDRTQHVLWRLDHGALEGIAPAAVVLLIGAVNVNSNSAAEVADGIGAIVARLRAKLPAARVLLLGVLPRGDRPNPAREKTAEINRTVRALADGQSIVYLDIGRHFVNPDGTISPDVMPDYLHLSPRGYEIWARAIEPTLADWLGPLPPASRPPAGPALVPIVSEAQR